MITCTSCKAVEAYPIKDYLNSLAYKSGLGDGEDAQDSAECLLNWQVITIEDVQRLDENLDYAFLADSIARLVEYEGDDNLNYLKQEGFIDNNKKGTDLVEKETAEAVIDKAVNIINNKEYETTYEASVNEGIIILDDYQLNSDILKTNNDLEIGDLVLFEEEECYKKVVDIVDGAYIMEDASFEDIFESLEFSGGGEINLEDAVIIPGNELEEDTSYVNNSGRSLLSSSTKKKTFNTDGFRVSYSIKTSGVSAHISKDIDGKNIYFDLSMTNINPTYKWDYKSGTLEGAYFKVDYHSTEKLGVSVGKYERYYLDFKDKDSSSFMNLLKSVVKQKDDEVMATIQICQIQTPIEGIPFVYFNIDVLAKIYASGKAELVLYNQCTKGFEVKDGAIRLINEKQRDLDFRLGGSAKACLGLNFNLETFKFRLMDVEFDAGIKASVTTTVHMYDSEGNDSTTTSDIAYSTVDEIAKENENIKVCGDVSLNWVLDIYVNTYKTVLHKFALWTKKSILDKDDQVFGNLTHIENGVFVKQCTRKNKFKTTKKNGEVVSIDKIILSDHAKVVSVNNTYQIEVTNLPSGYKTSDLSYSSSDSSIASVKQGLVFGNKVGSCEITVKTNDDKYQAVINILVSSG